MTSSNIQLLRQWAPIINVHNNEAYLPCSVEWYLGLCELLDQNGNSVISPISDPSALADASLGQREEWHVSILKPQATIGGQPLASLPAIPVYGYVRTLADASGTQYTDLDYWALFAYNGNTACLTILEGLLAAGNAVSWVPFGLGEKISLSLIGNSPSAAAQAIEAANGIGLHQADWVQCTVRLDSQGQFLALYLAQHSGGTWYTESQVTWFNSSPNDRPVVYAAAASHEFYNAPGGYVRLAGLAMDVCVPSDAAHTWDTQGTVVDVGWTSSITQSIQTITTPLSSPLGTQANQSMAANNAGLVALVGQATPGVSAYSVVIGNWEGGETAPTFWNKGQPISTVPASPSPAGQGVPSVTLSETGAIQIYYYQAIDGQLAMVTGTIDAVAQQIAWVNSGNPVYYCSSTDGAAYASAPPSASIATSSPDDTLPTTYVVAVHALYSQHFYYWWAGMLDPSTSAVTSWVNGGQKFDTGVPNDHTSPSVAVNANGMVVEVHEANGNLYWKLGTVDLAGTSSTVVIPGTSVDSTQFADNLTNPLVAINDQGQIIVLATSTTTGASCQYILGLIEEPDEGEATLSFGTATPFSTYAGATICSVSLRNDNTGLALVQQSSQQVLVGFEVVDDFLNWTPSSGAMWMKYSGRWGSAGDPAPCFSLPTGDTVYVNEAGPPGPAARSTFITGPDQPMPSGG